MNNNFNNGYEPEIKRNYTPEEMGHDKFRKPISKKRRKRRNRVNFGLVILSLVFCIIVGVCAFLILRGEREELVVPPIVTETDLEDTEPFETEPPREITVTVSESDIHTGNLILVNYSNPYTFADKEISEIVNVKNAKNDMYLVSKANLSLRQRVIDVCNVMFTDMYAANGCKYMQVNSAYRSYDDQVATYEYYKDQYSEDYAKKYVANPGYSEHHTGLALDLNVNVNGKIYYVESYEGCAWFRENAEDYGFILRYPAEKMYITGISGETWHYRYVGAPHAEIMNSLDFVLEEYIDYLKNYTYDTYCLFYQNDMITKASSEDEVSGGYLVYYVPSAGETTEIKVPNLCEYQISGNNVDGYVVTVAK